MYSSSSKSDVKVVASATPLDQDGVVFRAADVIGPVGGVLMRRRNYERREGVLIDQIKTNIDQT